MIKLKTFLQTYLLYLLLFVLGHNGVTSFWYTGKFRLMDPSVSLTSRHFCVWSCCLRPPLWLPTARCISRRLDVSVTICHRHTKMVKLLLLSSCFSVVYSHITLMPRSSRTRRTGRRHILGSLILAKLGKTEPNICQVGSYALTLKRFEKAKLALLQTYS